VSRVNKCAAFGWLKLEPKLCLAVALAAAGLSGCAREAPALPLACTEGPDSVRAALASAPARVQLGGVRISDCVRDAGDAGEVQAVGASLLGAAAVLADEARSAPGGDAELRLGYLVGAARAGAADSQGIHDEMVRRLEQELLAVDPRSPAFRSGEQAGRRSG
jgi:hypothetical protein